MGSPSEKSSRTLVVLIHGVSQRFRDGDLLEAFCNEYVRFNLTSGASSVAVTRSKGLHATIACSPLGENSPVEFDLFEPRWVENAVRLGPLSNLAWICKQVFQPPFASGNNIFKLVSIRDKVLVATLPVLAVFAWWIAITGIIQLLGRDSQFLNPPIAFVVLYCALFCKMVGQMLIDTVHNKHVQFVKLKERAISIVTELLVLLFIVIFLLLMYAYLNQVPELWITTCLTPLLLVRSICVLLTTVALIVAYRVSAIHHITSDIRAYVESDENRKLILGDVRKQLLDVTNRGRSGAVAYDHIVIFGHSLGSQIALDALTEIGNEPANLAKIHDGRSVDLVTYGASTGSICAYFPSAKLPLLKGFPEVPFMNALDRWINVWHRDEILGVGIDQTLSEKMSTDRIKDIELGKRKPFKCSEFSWKEASAEFRRDFVRIFIKIPTLASAPIKMHGYLDEPEFWRNLALLGVIYSAVNCCPVKSRGTSSSRSADS